MPELRAHGIRVDLPPGWEGSIFRRRPGPGESTHPLVHLSTFPLPPERDDFGAGAVESMRSGDVFVTLFDHGPESAGSALFGHQGLPLPLDPDDFHPAALQRRIAGHAGLQKFFTFRGRGFSLYVVLGSHRRRRSSVPAVNAVLATLQVEP